MTSDAFERAVTERIGQALFHLGQGAHVASIPPETVRCFIDHFEPNLREQLALSLKRVDVRAAYVLSVVRTIGAKAAMLATHHGLTAIWPEHFLAAADAVRIQEKLKRGGDTDFCIRHTRPWTVSDAMGLRATEHQWAVAE